MSANKILAALLKRTVVTHYRQGERDIGDKSTSVGWQRTGAWSSVMMRTVRSIWVCLSLALIGVSGVAAQDVPFNPRYDGIADRKTKPATPTPDENVKQTAVYSFARFASLFKVLCEGLEADRRRARVFEIATVGLREEVSCASCRAFYRQLVQSCAAPRRKKPQETPTASAEVGAVSEASVEGEQKPSPTPTATPTPQPDRYPRTEVIDAASRLSISLYEMEPGEGSPFKAVRSFEARVLAQKNLSPGERDYFGVLISYLLSAWAGREDELIKPKPLTRDDIVDLFQ